MAGESAATEYAAPYAHPPVGSPVIAVLLDGLGYDTALTERAISQSSNKISLAISPYSPAAQDVASEARAKQHEIYVSLPMQPSSAPTDDEGPRALGYSNSGAQNQTNLRWALSRFTQFVGVTNAMSGLSGNEFALSPDFTPIAHEIHERGLLYLNASIGQTPDPHGTNADISVDTSTDAPGIDAQLARATDIARNQGHAVVVAGPLTPVLLDRLDNWARNLGQSGLTLVPVSALAPASSNPKTEAH